MKTKTRTKAGAFYQNQNGRSIKLATLFCKIIVRSNVTDPWKIVVTANANPWEAR